MVALLGIPLSGQCSYQNQATTSGIVIETLTLLHLIMGTIDGMDGMTKFAYYISWVRILFFYFSCTEFFVRAELGISQYWFRNLLWWKSDNQ